jgi:[ribosomal protein S5]-alanine N-acetyltransferase
MAIASKQFISTTERLAIRPVADGDTDFIQALTNSEGWLRFIGNRNINTPEDAVKYIEKLTTNDTIQYWVVSVIETGVPAGVITFVQRDYLQHPDIGFAFLPEHGGKGYAFEAANAIIQLIKEQGDTAMITAITLLENIASIKLLKKLGLQPVRQMEADGELLQVFELAL